jgi:DNA polymerase-3 subunit alpha
MRTYFGIHNHTYYSNIRLLDSINRPTDLIDKAIELGLSGIAITDHECLSAHMEVNQYAKKIKEKYPDFLIALGNEIYLVNKREPGQKYFHFLLIAKDALGHKALRELSSIAWYNSFVDRGMERVPVTKEELAAVVTKYKGHLIATTACMGGELSTNALGMAEAENVGDMTSAKVFYDEICAFVDYCVNLFGDDFYIECAPSTANDQRAVNAKLYRIAKAYNIPMVIGTDSHYLTKADRFVHKSYLNSKGGEREVDSFYEFAHLMTYDEAEEILALSFNNDKEIASQIIHNTMLIHEKITEYSLERKQMIPKVEVKDYPKVSAWEWDMYPTVRGLLASDNIQERYWVNECIQRLAEMGLDGEPEYAARLETEADVIKYIGEKLDDCLFAYFNTFKHYIDLFWECGSIVGPGRGSATGFLSNYLLGITQLDPIRWKLPYWRFLNKERAELPDIDIDLAPSKRPAIFEAIRKERGELGLIQVATFGTEGTKSAILTACRGYRSEDYPDGIDVDQAQYMSSLIPQERGFLWSISDVVYGNEEKDRKPVTAFIREVENYPGLLDIIKSIEGVVNKRSSHASGVILYGEDPYETAAFMRTPSGDLITCYDLHMAEAGGDTKYDFLVTEISDKIIQCFNLLKADGVIEDMTLRDTYNKYIHPEVMDTTDERIWEHLAAGDVLDVFQFSTGVGLAIAKKLKPKDPMEMTAANAMMRLMSEKGKESQQDRYVRIQSQGLEVFDYEMHLHNLPDNMIKLMHKHCDRYWGCCAIQEQMMEILMEVANFTLGEANAARKVVAKKQMSKIPELRKQVYEKINNPTAADYIWEVAVAPQLGYAFSLNHSLPYSFVGMQSIFLAYNFNPIYWNTACLIVNSGSLEDNSEEEVVDIYAPEAQDLSEGVTFQDLPDRSGKIRRTAATDYGKIAKAIGDIQAAGIKVSLANINKSKFGFAPDVENNRILFGLKGMLNVGDDVVDAIIKNRPYASPKDFLARVKPGKQAMVSLIKGGAFDDMEDRKFVMAWYLWETCDKKKRITLQNMAGLMKYDLIPSNTEAMVLAKRVYEFNRYLKAACKGRGDSYMLDERALNFIMELGEEKLLTVYGDNFELNAKEWDKKIYQKHMDVIREFLNNNKDELLNQLNSAIFMEDWNKYAKGTISAWEMEVLCFYYHEHELSCVNADRYGFADFFSLPEDPEIDKTFIKSGKEIHIFKLHRICGTCIAKNKTKGTVTILTTTGVVNVKFRKEYFSLFDKQISERGADGVKHVVEKSWFNRGNMIVVTGIRSGDDFVSKKYASTGGHQLYKIDSILEDGELRLKDSRYQGGVEEDA